MLMLDQSEDLMPHHGAVSPGDELRLRPELLIPDQIVMRRSARGGEQTPPFIAERPAVVWDNRHVELPNEALANSSDAAQLRSNELEIDVLVSHELATQSAAGDLFWKRLGLQPPTLPPRIVRQEARQNDGRTTDVAVHADDGRTLLIEDKGTGGHFEYRQVESYEAERAASANLWIVLVAPAEFIALNKVDVVRFDAALSLEELAQALEDAGPQVAHPELERSYRFRAQLFRRAAERGRPSLHPDEDVAQFGSSYQEFVARMTAGRLQASRIASRWSRIIEFPIDDGLRLSHHLGSKREKSGLVDCQFVGMPVEALSSILEGLPAGRKPPESFAVCKKGRRGSALRCKVPYIANEDEELPVFEDIQHIVTAVVEHAISLLDWLARDGKKVLGRSKSTLM